MPQPKFKFELNVELRDRVTGYTGLVMCRSDYATGCRHYSLQSYMDKDGKVPEWQSFDESRLDATGRTMETLKKAGAKDPSGPVPKVKQW